MFHAINGKFGLQSRLELSTRTAQLERELADVEQRRAALHHQVSLLQEDHPDLDAVDEYARALLNFSHPDDVIYSPSK